MVDERLPALEVVAQEPIEVEVVLEHEEHVAVAGDRDLEKFARGVDDACLLALVAPAVEYDDGGLAPVGGGQARERLLPHRRSLGAREHVRPEPERCVGHGRSLIPDRPPERHRRPHPGFSHEGSVVPLHGLRDFEPWVRSIARRHDERSR